jgi:hypothetical protein
VSPRGHYVYGHKMAKVNTVRRAVDGGRELKHHEIDTGHVFETRHNPTLCQYAGLT